MELELGCLPSMHKALGSIPVTQKNMYK
jgi:hypothetical protein